MHDSGYNNITFVPIEKEEMNRLCETLQVAIATLCKLRLYVYHRNFPKLNKKTIDEIDSITARIIKMSTDVRQEHEKILKPVYRLDTEKCHYYRILIFYDRSHMKYLYVNTSVNRDDYYTLDRFLENLKPYLHISEDDFNHIADVCRCTKNEYMDKFDYIQE